MPQINRIAWTQLPQSNPPSPPSPNVTLNATLGASGHATLEKEILNVFGRAFQLWQDRQRKYGPSNIAATGELGCMVRANDKIARLQHALMNGSGLDSKDETLIDSWLDLLNYAAMGLMCHEGSWPGVAAKC